MIEDEYTDLFIECSLRNQCIYPEEFNYFNPKLPPVELYFEDEGKLYSVRSTA